MKKGWVILILTGVLLTACGYKADLYLPDSPSPQVVRDKQKAEKGVEN